MPGKYKDEKWARLGVNVDNEFEPLYVVDPRKRKVVSELKAKLKDADELLLATDEDREGEAIAWHLRPGAEAEGAGAADGLPRDHARRDRAALTRPREIDRRLVDAQEARRILDRLYGYEVSPVLWRKVMHGAVGRAGAVRGDAAGRRAGAGAACASSPPTTGTSSRHSTRADVHGARSSAVDGARVAQGRDFGRDGGFEDERCVLLDEDDARELAAALDGALPRHVRRGEAVHAGARRRRS